MEMIFFSLIQLVCIIVPEEGDIAAFKNLTETDLGESGATSGPVAPAPSVPVPSAPAPSTSGTAKAIQIIHLVIQLNRNFTRKCLIIL